jgi:hypothetical protein
VASQPATVPWGKKAEGQKSLGTKKTGSVPVLFFGASHAPSIQRTKAISPAPELASLGGSYDAPPCCDE